MDRAHNLKSTVPVLRLTVQQFYFFVIKIVDKCEYSELNIHTVINEHDYKESMGL